jgi:hypothetical protein
LRLDFSAEIEAAGMATRREIEGADPQDYEPAVDLSEFNDVYQDRH